MTVCVAAIAARSRAIVMVADKAITYGTERPMQAESGIRKILPIVKTGWHALIGGDPSFAQEVIDSAADVINKESDLGKLGQVGTLHGMMRCVKDSYKKTRRQWIADRFLAPRLLNETNPFSDLPDDYKV
jgi:hypothetical protein